MNMNTLYLTVFLPNSYKNKLLISLFFKWIYYYYYLISVFEMDLLDFRLMYNVRLHKNQLCVFVNI